MSLTVKVGVLTEEDSLVPSRAEGIRFCAEQFAEVEDSVRRAFAIDWAEHRMPWGTRPHRCRFSEHDCAVTWDFFVTRFGCMGAFCEGAHAVYTALCYATGEARLNRYRYDAAPYGYAVPAGFRGFAHNVGPFSDAFVVSAAQLAAECELLAVMAGPASTEATRFCLALRDVALHSLQTGCAVVFDA